MQPIERLQSLADRISTYSPVEVVVELVLIWLVVFATVRFLRGTRAAGALKAIFVILAAATLALRLVGGAESLQRLAYLYDRILALIAVALVVIFQPELRRGLIRLGEARIFRRPELTRANAVDPVVEACGYLAKARFGAIIVIERRLGLRGLVEGGTEIHGELSARLLQTIFFPGSALHDLAVLVRGTKINAAGVQLPLAEPGEMPDPNLGSRHRAAVGVTRESDAIVVVVSEETGHIRIAERGRLSRPYTAEELGDELTRRLEAKTEQPGRRAGDKPLPDEMEGLSAEPLSAEGEDAEPVEEGSR